jgi:1-phosphatidylinositol phosphodiesterase
MHQRQTIVRLLPLLLLAIAVSIGFDRPLASDGAVSFEPKPRAATVQKYSDWMSRLSDDAKLSELSLPGTHDSGALYDGLSFGFAKCQAWQLTDQLSAGMRFLDIRCRRVDDQLLVYHGIIDQHLTFREVCDASRTFLEKHPSECIVMSVKEEAAASNSKRSFAELFSVETEHDGDLWHVARDVPRLKDVRGRIVLIDRAGTLGGILWDDLNRQDQYEAPLDVKMRVVRQQFETATQGGADQWYINFCCGVLARQLVTPRQYAAQSNRATLGFLNQSDTGKRRRLGTVVLDFPGEDLVARIVESNFDSAPAK